MIAMSEKNNKLKINIVVKDIQVISMMVVL